EEIEGRLRELTASLGEAERRAEALEDATEDLRAENLRADRTLLRLESGSGRRDDRRLVLSRLRAAVERTTQKLDGLQKRAETLPAERDAARRDARDREREVHLARGKSSESGRERSRLAAELDGLRARQANLSADGGGRGRSEEDLAPLRSAVEAVEAVRDGRPGDRARDLGIEAGRALGRVETCFEGVSRRRGALAAAVGRAESRVRRLRAAEPASEGTRLYEVVRPRPGFEAAVEAALGDHGAGLLAENLDEGVRLLSETDPVALRLDAEHAGGAGPGRPLLECVEVLDGRYAGAVERLLGGIFVVDHPGEGVGLNGHVAVTTDGLRLTRTSVSMKSAAGNFARGARLDAEMDLLEALKNGPGETLSDLRDRIQTASERLASVSEDLQTLRGLSEHASRASSALRSEAVRRLDSAEKRRRRLLEQEREEKELYSKISETEAAFSEAQKAATSDREASERSTSAAEAARARAADSERTLRSLGAAISDGRNREEALSRRLRKASSTDDGGPTPDGLAKRAADLSASLLATVRGRRSGLRAARAELSEAHRRTSEER
ncbi:MAG TPA: hypothetical protein VGV91_10095, partial [Rubrobacter sp.]|nr:hypothetical protein [Rubrobacter sp.]